MKKIAFCLAVLILSMSILSGLATAQRSPVPVMGLFIDQNTMTLTVGSFSNLSWTITPANATNNLINWTSSRPGVATVSPAGTSDSAGIVRIDAIAPGNTVITAITEDGRYTATCMVTVRGTSPTPTQTPVPVMGLFIDQNTMTLTVGSFGDLSGTITPANATNNLINWTSTRPDVATVFPVRTIDSVGIVRINAIAPGETVITAITEDGRYTATCVVTVRGTSPTPTPTPTPIPTPRTGGATIVTAWMALGMLGAGFAFKRLKR